MMIKNAKKVRVKKNPYIEKLLASEKPTIEIHIIGLKCKVEVNEEIYSKEDKKRLTYILKTMAKNIWIDKTYVAFKGNRWKDAFIDEERWYELVKTILSNDFGRKSRMSEAIIVESLMSIALVYLYDIAEKYGFEAENINIEIPSKAKFETEYLMDNRTNWRS